jgi:hypothetical protein
LYKLKCFTKRIENKHVLISTKVYKTFIEIFNTFELCEIIDDIYNKNNTLILDTMYTTNGLKWRYVIERI